MINNFRRRCNPYMMNNNNPSMNYNNKTMQNVVDTGAEPTVWNIEQVTTNNENFRTTIWTGEHLQITVMSIDVGDSIGLEMHEDNDQFIRLEKGVGMVQMGKNQNNLNFQRKVSENDAFVVPAKTWHNLVNIGNEPIKLYSIYAPPHHAKGTVHKTKADALKE